MADHANACRCRICCCKRYWHDVYLCSRGLRLIDDIDYHTGFFLLIFEELFRFRGSSLLPRQHLKILTDMLIIFASLRLMIYKVHRWCHRRYRFIYTDTEISPDFNDIHKLRFDDDIFHRVRLLLTYYTEIAWWVTLPDICDIFDLLLSYIK